MADVAALLNRCTILLDCSTFQGFGRPGLEAMATRTAAVLTRNGGITEYAKHLHNCLLADPLDVDENVAKIIQLADDVDLRRRLIDRGVNTAKQYDARLEGARTRSFLRSLVGLE
jgi:glycosyltransferase involved in cell wall biosynthesis